MGHPIRLNGTNVTVVGIMPAHFEFSSPWMQTVNCDLWRPLQLQREQPGQWWCTLGCLKPGVTLAAADAEIKTIGARLYAAHPVPHRQKTFSS